jgi:hypothetical protein
MSKLKLTDAQIEEIGHIVAANWGGHFQTGYTLHPPDGNPQIIILWVKMSPEALTFNYQIHPDGTVIKDDMVDWDGRSFV